MKSLPNRIAISALLGAALLGVCLLTAGSSSGQSAPTADDPSAHPGRLVQLPDGRRMNFRCSGAGSPTVIFESGFEGTSMAWYKVAPLIAKSRRACAYDRAGSGFSDAGPLPRDGASIAKDLDQGLKAAGIGGPYVMVGHSAGGLYVRLFADRRPRDVVGMVLVDPSVEHQDTRFAAAFGPGAGALTALHDRVARCLAAAERNGLPSGDPQLAPCVPPRRPQESVAAYDARLAQAVRPAAWRTQLSELDTLWTTTSDQMDLGRSSYGDMPLIVLTATTTYAGPPGSANEAAGRLWTSLHREIAARSSRGEEQAVAGSGHLMMLDRPDAIAAAVEKVISEARR